MRLLKRNGTDDVSLTEDLIDDDIPRYAILPHRWGAATEEMSFQDLINGTGKDKPGYNKIRFCIEQAHRDGLQYSWVDTCCIDKTNNSEPSEAINSMFRWYQNAAVCYVYLADVSRPTFGANDQSTQTSWELEFRKSTWFTRGWTLQELLAPASVEFFSKEGKRLGNKGTLERQISEITGISIKALRGNSLHDFSISERISWQESRGTTRKEDKAYSLLGICGIHMPLLYGEGGENAFIRLRKEIAKVSKGELFVPSVSTRGKESMNLSNPWNLLTRKGINREEFSVPFSLSNVSDIKQFVGREKELGEMQKALHGDGSRRTVILHGLGGIGKTQLTIAHVKRHKDSHSAIFWLNIKVEDTLKQSFIKIAMQISRAHPLADGLSSVDTKAKPDEVVDAVKA
jgi:hypothetical protein